MDLTEIGICIMTGGKSSRMGQDKATLTIRNDETLLERLCHQMSGFEYKYISVNENQNYTFEGYTTVTDEYRQIGPIGGIVSVLKSTPATAVLFVACDMPFYNIKDAEDTIEHWRGEDVVVPVCNNRYQPLAAIYSRASLPVLEDAIERGEYKLRPAIEELNYIEFTPTNIEAYINVNTKEELEKYIAGENDTANWN